MARVTVKTIQLEELDESLQGQYVVLSAKNLKVKHMRAIMNDNTEEIMDILDGAIVDWKINDDEGIPLPSPAEKKSLKEKKEAVNELPLDIAVFAASKLGDALMEFQAGDIKNSVAP